MVAFLFVRCDGMTMLPSHLLTMVADASGFIGGVQSKAGALQLAEMALAFDQ